MNYFIITVTFLSRARVGQHMPPSTREKVILLSLCILYYSFPDMSHVSVVVIGGDQDDTLTKVMDSSLETNNHSSSSSQVN